MGVTINPDPHHIKVHMNLFLKTLEIKGFPIKKASSKLLAIQSTNVVQFHKWVDYQRKQQFDFFVEHNTFYQSFIQKSKDTIDFKSPPILTKKDIQIPLSNLLSIPYLNQKLFRNNTSGSTGTPFFFAKDKYSHAMTWALIHDRYRWHGIEYGKSLQARFYGIPLNGLKYYIEKTKDLIAKRIRFPVFDLSEKKLWEFIETFKKYPFEYINGYTSSLVYFASFCCDNNINLKHICPSLKVCFPTSEMCSLQDKDILKKGFGIDIAVEYGCAEMDVIAFEDKEGDWIISNENVFVEVVDEHGFVLPDGKEGRIVLTSLFNKSIPLYRYDVGDIGILKPERKGKYQVLEKLIGRVNEFAILPSGRKIPALTFYYITKMLIQEKFKIKEFVIRQNEIDLFIFEYVSEEELPLEAKESVCQSMNIYLEPGLKAQFEKKTIIQRENSGKLRQFYRAF
jgi:phenylacetate-CoA ligase